MDNKPYAVEMKAITKQFPGVLANDNVDFELQEGEIHALLGENGAGKSTLMNILTGLYKPDTGQIFIEGKPVSFGSPKDAIEHGIGMVHQHFMLVPTQTVTENILLGLDEPRFVVNLRQYDSVIEELGQQYGLHVDPRAKIWQLSVGEQQRVEILKMLYRGTDVLIMDEPTAVLAPQEIEELFLTLRSMTKEGKSIVFISHKLDEVVAIADRTTVLRKGKVTASAIPIGETNKNELAQLMVGREVLFRVDRKEQEAGELVLEVENIHALNDKGLPALRGVTLDVRSGEIVGLAGVAGNGQSELAEVITGLRPMTEGKIRLHGQDLAEGRPLKGASKIRHLIDAGISHIPEDRTHVGTAPNLSITDNIIMKGYRQAPISRGWSINHYEAQHRTEGLREEYDIMVPSIETPARLLSGGNLQRVILAREISRKPKLTVAVQPTRGLDVGAIEGVQRLLLEQREAGAAVLLISEELEELLTLCDRIYVIYQGEIMGEVSQASANQIGRMMTGTPLAELERGEA
jgi:simple sugar transport system ATP-binding protein